ncbi:MAG: hypothetical protein ACLUDG_02595 [Butyricicoccus sp.]
MPSDVGLGHAVDLAREHALNQAAVHADNDKGKIGHIAHAVHGAAEGTDLPTKRQHPRPRRYTAWVLIPSVYASIWIYDFQKILLSYYIDKCPCYQGQRQKIRTKGASKPETPLETEDQSAAVS